MFRIFQSRKRLTQSIVSASKAEEEALAANKAAEAEETQAEDNGSEKKRQLEETHHDTFENTPNGDGNDETDSAVPPSKKAALSPAGETTGSTIATSISENDPIASNVIHSESTLPASLTKATNDGDSACAATPEKFSCTEPNSPQQETNSMEIDLITPEKGVLEQNAEITIEKDEGNRQEDDDHDDEIQVVSPTKAISDVDPDICIVAPPERPALFTSDAQTKNDTNDDDEDIQIVSSTTVNPNIQYPHKRTDCGIFDFSKNPKLFCDKCYCLICDIPAKDCTDWKDHAGQTSRPSNPDSGSYENEGYDVTDEILLESPTTTRQNYAREHEQEQQLQERETIERENSRVTEKDFAKMRITKVLDEKLDQILRKRRQTIDLEFSEASRNEIDAKRNSMEGDIPQLGLHAAFFVEGIKIGWPFPTILMPQRQMAIHIIKALKRKLHVVLESPTGTGKSVAILCSVLAWQRYHIQTESEKDKDIPRIIYCSRTHSQITQMVASLKKTPYRPKMTVMGSRDRLCIHKQLTGKNREKNKSPLNVACQGRKRNTEAERQYRLRQNAHNDDHPIPPQPNWDSNTDGVDENSGDNENIDDNTFKRRPRPTCPHYRQLTSNTTAEIIARQLIGEGGGCCGNSGAVGGEESAFGVHDMEDMVRLGKNPHKEENIAVYRGENGKFGFVIDGNTNEAGQIKMGCHVVSLVNGGSAAFEGRLQGGDHILKVNGIDVRTSNKRRVVELLGQTPMDQPARLDVLRANSDTPQILDPSNDPFEFDAENGEETDQVYSEQSICPYYVSRTIQKHAEITFSPYNYVLDPAIRRVMNIDLNNTVLVLDEAHNVESTLCEGGSGKYGEIDLFQLVCSLGKYAHRTNKTSNITLIKTGVNVDLAELAHDLLLFVEKIIFHLRSLREQFEKSPGQRKLEEEHKKYRSLPDDHEVELSYDGPTGYGIKGEAVGCKPLLTKLDITKDECFRLLECASSMEQSLFGENPTDDEDVTGQGDNSTDDEDVTGQGDNSNVLTTLIGLLENLLAAAEHPEHYYMSCVVQANGNLDHALGINENDDGNRSRRRFKKKPRKTPFMAPRTPKNPDSNLNVCNVGTCKNQVVLGSHHDVRHGDYCNGSTPQWECHLVLRLLSPGLLMREISQECRSVVLASGSLAPIPSLCAELNLFGNESTTVLTPSSQSCLSQTASPAARSYISGGNLPSTTQSILASSVESSHGEAEKVYTNRLQTTPKPLEANHVVNLSKQLLAVAIGNFPNGEKLTVSYINYKNPAFFPKFGHAVASVIEGVPRGGCLVFFPSHSFLNKCVSCWNAPTRYNAFQVTAPDVWNRLLRSKGKVILEPTGSQEDFEKAKDEYKETVRDTGSCILFAVFRGKMSEGISFNDDNARAVICIGMPYPNYTDRGVKAKQNYNDEQRKLRQKTCLLPGIEYYSQQAHRAIAQALGRCIRHGADYGTVILMDSRHCDDGSPNSGICRAHKNLPKWMRGGVRTLSMHARQGAGKQPILNGYAGLRREMRSFFASAPIVSQSVRDKWKADLEKVQQRSDGSSQMVFHRESGNWTTAADQSSSQGNGQQVKNEKTNLQT